MVTTSKRAAIVVSSVACACALLATEDARAIPIAHLTLDSQPGDFIGQGLDFDITYIPTNSDFFSSEVRRTIGPDDEPAELLFLLGTVTEGPDNTFALLFFGTDALGIPIQPGFYPDAERADFASPGHPGLDVSFQNRGCNRLTGSFTVHDVVFSDEAEAATGSSVETFSATFEQHCEGAAAALFGSFSYDAFGEPPQIPEPGTLGLLGVGLLGLGLTRRKAN